MEPKLYFFFQYVKIDLNLNFRRFFQSNSVFGNSVSWKCFSNYHHPNVVPVPVIREICYEPQHSVFIHYCKKNRFQLSKFDRIFFTMIFQKRSSWKPLTEFRTSNYDSNAPAMEKLLGARALGLNTLSGENFDLNHKNHKVRQFFRQSSVFVIDFAGRWWPYCSFLKVTQILRVAGNQCCLSQNVFLRFFLVWIFLSKQVLSFPAEGCFRKKFGFFF